MLTQELDTSLLYVRQNHERQSSSIVITTVISTKATKNNSRYLSYFHRKTKKRASLFTNAQTDTHLGHRRSWQKKKNNPVLFTSTY